MANYSFINSTGVIVPDTSDLLTDVQNEFKTAFGSDLDVSPETPQGLLITAEVLARDSVVRNNAALANQINPNLAGGVFEDAICALTALERIPATRSIVEADLTGVASTIIPAGTKAKTVTNDLFELQNTVVLDVSGEAVGIFQSVEYGPIGAPAGDLNQIVDGVLGWETINNALDAELGRDIQSDQSLRALRKLTLAIQGIGLSEAIVSALYNTEGVKSLQFRENVAATTQVIDGISMVSHSVYACVDGGTDDDVAETLLNNKSGGAAWNGSTIVNVVEPYSGQSYEVKFDRPTEIDILVRATVTTNSALIDPISATKAAILAYMNGELEGEAGLTVGTSVSPFELAGAVNRSTPGIFVQNMEIKTGVGSYSNSVIAIAIDEVARIAESDITVVVV